MQRRHRVLGLGFGLLGLAFVLPGCGGKVEQIAADGGNGGGAGGASGSDSVVGGSGGTATAGSAGAGGRMMTGPGMGTPGTSTTCMGKMCAGQNLMFGGMGIPLNACCPPEAPGECGASNPIANSCISAAKGTADPTCPGLSVMGFTLAGCCMSNNVCGVNASAIGFGCTSTASVNIGGGAVAASQSCGAGAVDAAAPVDAMPAPDVSVPPVDAMPTEDATPDATATEDVTPTNDAGSGQDVAPADDAAAEAAPAN